MMAVIRKLHCQVNRLQDHGEGVYTLELVPEKNLPQFHPGQFLHLALDEYEPSGFWPDSRAFSIASAPEERDRLRISYAVKGEFTRRMQRELELGRWVWVKLPYGEFVVGGEGPVVLIAGGTGITAFSAFVAGLGSQPAHDTYLFYGARRTDLLIERERLAEAAAKTTRLHVQYWVEEMLTAQSEDAISQPRVGRLSIDAIWPQIINPYFVTYYLSGPPAMLQNFRAALVLHGVAQEKIRVDAWE